MKSLVIAAVLAAFAAASTASAATAIAPMDTASGKVLTGAKGMTLYTFKKDTPGVSNCIDKCAATWPPVEAKDEEKVPAPYSVIERKDGTYQLAKDGMPLYYFVKDAKPGDTLGEGVGDVWTVARP